MKMPKRLLMAAGAAALLIYAIVVIFEHMHHGGRGTVPTVTTATQKPPARPVHRLPPKRPAAGTARPHWQDALSAAALAMSDLSQAQLLPASQMEQVVTATVVPAQRSTLMRAYKLTGKALTKFLGYASVSQTHLAADYWVEVQKYRLGWFKPPTATFWFYTVSHWITDQNLEYFIPSISVVQMRLVKGQWLFVDVHDPPASQRPAGVDNLSYDQEVLRFQPFLKGFKPYEGS